MSFEGHIRVASKRIKRGYGLKYANHAFKGHIRVSIKIEYGKIFYLGKEQYVDSELLWNNLYEVDLT